MKFSHATLVYISGAVWMLVGIFLLQLGLNLILGATEEASILSTRPLMQFFHGFLGSYQQAGIVLVALSLYIGFLKGKHVLRKTAEKNIKNLVQYPNPTSLSKVYGVKYCMLLAAMVALGMLIKYAGLPHDIRGFIDVAVGAALIQGAVCYFRSGYSLSYNA